MKRPSALLKNSGKCVQPFYLAARSGVAPLRFLWGAGGLVSEPNGLYFQADPKMKILFISRVNISSRVSPIPTHELEA